MDDLIKRLRSKAGAFDYDGRPDIACDYEQAADAIEELNLTHDESADYQRGLDDAWEAARKIVDSRNFTELSSAFDGGNDETGGFTVRTPYYVIQNYTAAEALARIRDYEETQKIHVGDEAERDGITGVVTNVYQVGDRPKETFVNVLYSGGNSMCSCRAASVKKKKRNFPEVAALLDKMKGDADESD